MNRLVIVGAGGFGREIRTAVEASPRFRERERISTAVFIDDDPDLTLLDTPVVSTIRDFTPAENDLGLCAIGSGVTRRALVGNLGARGLRFVVFVDDTARVGPSVTLAEGVVICGFSTVTVNSVIGRHTHVNCLSGVGHDTAIGEYVTVSSGSQLGGHTIVEDDVFLGLNATVIPGRRIGAGAKVAAGSVVLRHVKPGTTVFGNPAKEL